MWLTLDPIGFEDGPNRYLYVHNNPITKFDPLGLRASVTVGKPQLVRTGFLKFEKVTPVKIDLPVVFKDKSGVSLSQSQIKDYADSISEKWSGKFGKYDVKTEVQIIEGREDANILDAKKEGFNIMTFAKDDGHDPRGETTSAGRLYNSATVKIGKDSVGNYKTKRTTQHEAGHMMGDVDIPGKGNIMRSGKAFGAGSKKQINYRADVNVEEHNIRTIVGNRKTNSVKYDSSYTGKDDSKKK